MPSSPQGASSVKGCKVSEPLDVVENSDSALKPKKPELQTEA